MNISTNFQKVLNIAFARFVISGLVNTGITYALYLMLTRFIDYRVSYGIVYVLGIIFSYWMSVAFVFKKKASLASFLKYPSVYIVQFILNILMLHLLVELAGLSKVFSPLLVLVLTIPVSYVLSAWVVRKNENR
ncbi:GtrA family protein [Chitinibacteraceae bacterium HSL-7]